MARAPKRLFQLATELRAALLARMLGIHIAVVAWQHGGAGDGIPTPPTPAAGTGAALHGQ